MNQYRMGLDQVVKLHGSTTAQSVKSETRRCMTTMELNDSDDLRQVMHLANYHRRREPDDRIQGRIV